MIECAKSDLALNYPMTMSTNVWSVLRRATMIIFFIMGIALAGLAAFGLGMCIMFAVFTLM